MAGELGGHVGVAPRVYLKKLVGDVLDRVDQFADFEPRRDYALTVGASELTAVEANARGGNGPRRRGARPVNGGASKGAELQDAA